MMKLDKLRGMVLVKGYITRTMEQKTEPRSRHALMQRPDCVGESIANQ